MPSCASTAGPRRQRGKPGPVRRTGAKATLRVAHGEEMAQISAAEGRVELRLPRDFAGVDRQRLERAVSAFFAVLAED